MATARQGKCKEITQADLFGVCWQDNRCGFSGGRAAIAADRELSKKLPANTHTFHISRKL